MTKAELQAACDKAGIKYQANDTKDMLQAALEGKAAQAKAATPPANNANVSKAIEAATKAVDGSKMSQRRKNRINNLLRQANRSVV